MFTADTTVGVTRTGVIKERSVIKLTSSAVSNKNWTGNDAAYCNGISDFFFFCNNV